ncbi:MAG TPA: hypothetical protein VI319_00940 [Burkholderiales bacterium]
MTTTLRAVLAKSAISACTLWCAAAADAQQYSGQEEARNLRLVGFHDLAARSAYQPTIRHQGERWILYVGHHGGRAVNPLTGKLEENGTSVLDVTDPAAPRLLAHIPGEKGREVPGRETGGAQMTRVCLGSELPKGDPRKVYLLRNFGDSRDEIWDVSTPEKPALVSQFGKFKSTHKNEWECASGIAYLPGSDPAYRASRVTHVYDLSDPAKPRFIRTFGLIDQLKDAKGYQPGQIHGPISAYPARERVYFGYGTNARGVAQVVDRQKLLKGAPEPAPPNLLDPQVVRINLPEFMGAHTAFPLLDVELPDLKAGEKKKRDFLVIVNENNVTVCNEPRQMAFFVDITDEKRPLGVASYDVLESSGGFCARGGRFGAHASNESTAPVYYRKLMFFSWFNAGVRMVDVRDPYRPKEVGYYIPARTPKTDLRCADEAKKTGCVPVIQINNVEIDERGYVYAVDRANSGLFVLEPTGEAREIAGLR